MFTKPKIAIQDFDYNLPDAQIAYTPAAKRSESKLLVWDQTILAESKYVEIASFIPAGSTLLFNNSKVIAARILFEKNSSAINIQNIDTSTVKQNSSIEIFCLEPTSNYTPVLLAMQAKNKVEWNCLVGGAKKWKEDALEKKVNINNQTVLVTAKKMQQVDGKFVIAFSWNEDYTFSEILTAIGNIPLPPYIQRKANEEDKDRYQTTYAIEEGSVAAPTAGLHFDEVVFKTLSDKNIHQKYLTLHVGAGTFMPVKSETIDEHAMHAEFIDVDLNLIQYIAENAGAQDKPLIAVGTTSLRTLESVYWMGVKAYKFEQENKHPIPSNEINLEQWEAYELADMKLSVKEAMNVLAAWLNKKGSTKLIAKTQLMVTPGYTFKICDALITNFHQPKSTLLLIIAAIVGDEWKTVYQHALSNQYRFLSYGDGCLFWIKQQAK
jgi:S-adenosylmethionine:tRNA ribosyltransferase-isomerase